MPTDRPAPPFSPHRRRFDRREEAPRLWDRPGPGHYRRRMVVRTVDPTTVRGELEDDFHHFRVEIHHDGAVVRGVEGTGIRGPWATCMQAGEPLREITGLAVTTHPAALGPVDARRNCTHMFDLAGLVVHHAARGGPDRRYDIEISDPVGNDDRRTATLWRDGEPLLRWELVDGEIARPDDWAGAPLRSRFIAWTIERFGDDHDGAEAAIALRRSIDISRGRLMDLDEMDTAEPLLPQMEGICHSMTADHAPLAIRHRGSARDFTHHPELLLGDFDARD